MSARATFASLVLALVGVACGGKNTGDTTTPDVSDAPDAFRDPRPAPAVDDEPRAAAPAAVATSAEALCARVFELKASHCEGFESFDLTPDECLADYRTSLASPADPGHAVAVGLGACLLEHAACAAVQGCIGALNLPAPPDEPPAPADVEP